MKIIGVIPVRYDSQRFPGKALARLWGKPLLKHVYERALRSSVLEEVIIATDNTEIGDLARGFGAPVVLTPSECANGTERVAQAVGDSDADIVVNIQGDQPLLVPQIVEEVVPPLLTRPELVMTTPIHPMLNDDQLGNPNIVKVVVDKEGFALYFSRAPLPYLRNVIGEQQVLYKHIGIYAFRKEFLFRYVQLAPGILEVTEGLEQLRVLEHGYRIMTVATIYDSPSVDTIGDLELLKKKDVLRKQ